MITYCEKLTELIGINEPFVAVTVVDAQGSAPQDAGAKMLVTRDGLFWGTVGGGKIERRAVEEAQRLLDGASQLKISPNNTAFVQWSLDRDIGMTCGGSVKVYFEACNLNPWRITVFGAGHVACALIPVLLNLDCKITCIDSRQSWLDKLPVSAKLTKILADDLPGQVKTIPDGSFVLLMTMGHASDKPILLEILTTRKFPYLGVIGSGAKAARLRKDIEDAGLAAECKKAFYCPIGLDIGTNHPQEIAISVAAQLIGQRDYHKGSGQPEPMPLT